MGNCLNKEVLQNTNENNETNNTNKLNHDLIESTYDVPEHSLNNLFIEGKVVNVYDGDTVHIVFLIENKLVKYNCRLLGIDSPEICQKNVPDKKKRELEIASAVKSRNYLMSLVTGGIEPPKELTKKSIKEFCGQSRKLVYVKCHNFDKYGRLLVEIFLNKSDIISVNKLMVSGKYAVEYDGGTKKEFVPTEITC